MFDSSEFRNIVNTVMHVDYLLLCLVLLYLAMPGTQVSNEYLTLNAGMVYTVVLIVLYYFIQRHPTYLLLSFKAIASVLFIGVVVWNTGKSNSPLLILYLLCVISTAMVLGKLTTMLLLGLISASLLFFDYSTYKLDLFSLSEPSTLIALAVNVFTLSLISYLAYMLSTHMQQAKESIKSSAELDKLTGLLNGRTFIHILKSQYDRFARYSNKFSLLRIDVDNIKTINEQYGYPIGDRALVLVANTLKRSARPSDIVARIHEDEFAVILAECSEEHALQLADVMRKKVEDTPLIIEGGDEVFLTISIGLASFPDDSDDLITLFKRAELVLFASKDEGKNRITTYSDIYSNNGENQEQVANL
jgi:diguanylate cyclase (GGDEF)-like protein